LFRNIDHECFGQIEDRQGQLVFRDDKGILHLVYTHLIKNIHTLKQVQDDIKIYVLETENYVTFHPKRTNVWPVPFVVRSSPS